MKEILLLKNRNINKDILDVYDIQLVEYGDYIIKDRLEYIDKIKLIMEMKYIMI